MEFEFTLKFMLRSDSRGTDELVECLGAAGCDDALVGIGQAGRIALDFTRESASAERAIFSALEQVKHAIPEAKLLEVTPDFVGLTDVAELIGVTRQNMRKLTVTHKETFPAAIHEGSAALWHLAPVLDWLNARGHYAIKESLLEVAYIAMQINLAKEAGQIEQRVHAEALRFVA
jgi:hypothetical protein